MSIWLILVDLYDRNKNELNAHIRANKKAYLRWGCNSTNLLFHSVLGQTHTRTVMENLVHFLVCIVFLAGRLLSDQGKDNQKQYL